MRTIRVVTGSHAEYGLLSRLMRMIKESQDCQLQVTATNMHLLSEYGNTYLEIKCDGFHIDAKVFMKKTSDDIYGVIASMSEEMKGMNEVLRRLSPDMVVILGDRYEMLVVAIIPMSQHTPIVHLYGGEISKGAVDDSIHHSITKMSSLHFTPIEVYRKRVIQLGEQPDRVFYAGSLGVENLQQVSLMNKQDLEASLDFTFADSTITVTYRPVTLDNRSPKDEIDNFLLALDTFPKLKVLFIMPNSDQGGDVIHHTIEGYRRQNGDCCSCYSSLGVRRYLSALQYVVAIVGNPSSGLIKVPSAHIPTLNVGEHQKGRIHGESVLSCGSDAASVIAGLNQALSYEFRMGAHVAMNPYEKENAAQLILDIISTYPLDIL